MLSTVKGLLSRRGRFGASQDFKKKKQSWSKRYLTASDEEAFGALTQILKTESFAESKERNIDCELTPRVLASENSGKDGDVSIDGRKPASEFAWPVFQDRTYGRFVKHFMFSFKNIYSENINSSNLMFFTGPTKCGKSALLRQNLAEFANTGKHVSPSFQLRNCALLSFPTALKWADKPDPQLNLNFDVLACRTQ